MRKKIAIQPESLSSITKAQAEEVYYHNVFKGKIQKDYPDGNTEKIEWQCEPNELYVDRVLHIPQPSGIGLELLPSESIYLGFANKELRCVRQTRVLGFSGCLGLLLDPDKKAEAEQGLAIVTEDMIEKIFMSLS
ncbi:MAG: hypothetical protein Q7T74_05840 [Candidatus Saccharibacteria bacterium]|nr:hypothetical protein [Candidatus Saccharibacteria bacterium]